jgi:predicted secreted protein
MSRVHLTGTSSRETVEVAPNTEILVTLPESPSSGCQWALTAVDTAVLSSEGSEYVAAGGLVGSGGVRTFMFRARHSGTTTLQLVYRRAPDDESAADEFRVTIKVR